MADRVVSITLSDLLISVHIDSVNSRVIVSGEIYTNGVPGLDGQPTQVVLATYTEDVTDQMTQAQKDAAILLRNAAQGWIDNKLANLTP